MVNSEVFGIQSCMSYYRIVIIIVVIIYYKIYFIN